MEKFWNDITSPYWLASVLGVGIAVNWISNWLWDQLKRFLAWNRVTSDKSITAERRKLARYVVYCHNDPLLAPMLAARHRQLMIRGVISAGMGLVVLFTIDHSPPAGLAEWLKVALPWIMYPIMAMVFLGAYLWVSDAVFSGRVFEAYTNDLIRAGRANDAEIDAQLAKGLPARTP